MDKVLTTGTLFALIFAIILIICIYQSPSPDKLSPATYVFIDHQYVAQKNIIETNLTGPQIISYISSRGNGYRFDERNRSLSYFSSFIGDVNSTIAILGETDFTNGNYQHGYTFRLYDINRTPAEVGGIRISGIDENGNVRLSYRNESFILKPGDEWVRVTSDITVDTVSVCVYDNSFFNVSTTTAKINVTATDWIKNYGISFKSDLSHSLGMIS
ncbi:MAG: hypothetical protein WBZ29_07740 [Methanocella sp.]